jgi:hypothetical protein
MSCAGAWRSGCPRGRFGSAHAPTRRTAHPVRGTGMRRPAGGAPRSGHRHAPPEQRGVKRAPTPAARSRRSRPPRSARAAARRQAAAVAGAERPAEIEPIAIRPTAGQSTCATSAKTIPTAGWRAPASTFLAALRRCSGVVEREPEDRQQHDPLRRAEVAAVDPGHDRPRPVSAALRSRSCAWRRWRRSSTPGAAGR